MELININNLIPHPRNYRGHPEDQLNHIMQSIKENGIYRNVVISSDNVILAGHGVVEACKKMGIEEIPIVRLAFSSTDPKALKVLTGDNEISRLGEIDNQSLLDILKEINLDDHLIGTGFDDQSLNSLDIDLGSHFDDLPDSKDEEETKEYKNKEIDPEDFQKFDYKCPKCDFEWNKK